MANKKDMEDLQRTLEDLTKPVSLTKKMASEADSQDAINKFRAAFKLPKDMSDEKIANIARYGADLKAGNINADKVINSNGKLNLFQYLSQELEKQKSAENDIVKARKLEMLNDKPLPLMDQREELRKIGLEPNEMSPQTLGEPVTGNKVEDMTGSRPIKIDDPAERMKLQASTQDVRVMKPKMTENAEAIGEKTFQQKMLGSSDDVLKAGRHQVEKGFSKSIGNYVGRKVFSAIPILGGLASAAMSGDVSAGIPILDSAENVGEGSDTGMYTPEQEQGMEAARMAREEDMLKPSRFNQLQGMINSPRNSAIDVAENKQLSDQAKDRFQKYKDLEQSDTLGGLYYKSRNALRNEDHNWRSNRATEIDNYNKYKDVINDENKPYEMRDQDYKDSNVEALKSFLQKRNIRD